MRQRGTRLTAIAAGSGVAVTEPTPGGSTITVLNGTGTSYTSPLTVLNGAGTSYTITAAALNGAGTSYTLS